MPIIRINDLSDPALAPYTKLTQAQLRNRRHPKAGLLIAESGKVIAAALSTGCRPRSFLMEERQLPGAAELLSACPEVPVYVGERALLQQLTGYALTRGILAAMSRPTCPTPEEICASARRIAVLENIVDPTNLGAIFRSAAALGMDAVLVSPSCCDPFHRRAVRVSMGSVFRIPWAQLGADADSWPTAGLSLLRKYGFLTVAMALEADSLSIRDPRLAGAERLALILGTEGDGLLPATIAACDHTVCIPMAHGVDSLNVAAAAAVAFWSVASDSSAVESC